MSSSHIYCLEITGTPQAGAFCAIDQLPADIVGEQVDFIRAAAAQFRNELIHSRQHQKAPEYSGAF